MSNTRRIVGFIVNPVAGMGGKVGLKGTDGTNTLQKALLLGAEPIAPTRAKLFLSKLIPIKEEIHLIVGSASMGEYEARDYEFHFEVVGRKKNQTTSEDTIKAAKKIIEKKAEILVFCGGDGTARDIQNAINTSIPVLGVPTGVKMHSGVFAVSPSAAAIITARFLFEDLPLREMEIMDVDETAFRDGRLSVKLHGYMLTPYEPQFIQSSKIATSTTESELHNQAAIALYVIEEMKNNIVYIIGPGTTTRTIADLLDEKKTILGVDIFLDKKIIDRDVNEKQILMKIQGRKAKIIVTPIGGQGFIFGRGNQQISSKVIRAVGVDNILVVATKSKLGSLKTLRVDTGDVFLDNELRGEITVIVDYKEERRIYVE